MRLPKQIVDCIMLISLLIFITTLGVDLYTDLRLWDSGKINHKRGAIIRCLALAVAAVFDVKILLLLPGYACVFDCLLCLFRGLPVFYVGTTSALDKLQRRYPALVWVKFGLGAAGVAAYLLR